MNLISKEDVLMHLNDVWLTNTPSVFASKGIFTVQAAKADGIAIAMNAIEDFKTVPAVPLDKLCEFLEKCGADSYCGTCKQIMGECFTDGRGCGSEHFWKELLTKWMEEQHESN